eukprot:3244210-Prymnesium_polylepis.1
MKPAHPKWLQGVSVYDNQPVRRSLVAGVFALGYALSIGYCISTAGEPYAAAVLERDRMDNLTNGSNATVNASEPSAGSAAAEGDAAPEVPVPATPTTPAPSPSPPAHGGFGDE